MELALMIGYLVAIPLSVVIGIIVRKKTAETKIQSAEEEAKRITEKAEEEADGKIKKAEITIKELELRLKENANREITEIKKELSGQERRNIQREEQLNKKEERIEKDFKKIEEGISEIERREKEVSNLEKEREDILQKLAEITKEEAKEIILTEMDRKLVAKKADILRKYEEDLKDNQKKMAKEILSLAIQRCAADHTSESTVSVVELPNDEIKGRIIGKEGRNIRSIEMLTGVQIIVDDTPESITISAFDPVRRAVAKLALEKLIEDGRIHPAKIEEMVEKALSEIQDIVREEGKRAMIESGVDDLPSEVISLLGKLRYRTSYGQNVLTHSIEVANLCSIMAGLVGANKKIAAKAGLLHDLGKALDHDPEVTGTHVELGVEVLRRNNEDPVVINAVEAHHGDVETESVEAVLVIAADAISSSRPGARRDTFEAYIRRLEALETIANSFEGVSKSYAIQAGREVRLIVNPEKISDDEMKVLAHEVAERIENEVEFPGQIKVMVLRETRRTDIAKQSKVNRV